MLEKMILPMVLATLMFGLGMSLVKEDFTRVLRRKRVVLAGLVSVLLLMPVVAFAIASALRLDPVLAMGLVLLAACPGGMFSNLVTHTARGDLALSMALTVLSSFLYVITVPSIVSVGASLLSGEGKIFSLSFTQTFFEVLVVVLVPVSAGMFLRRLAPGWCARREHIVRNVASAFVVLVFVYLGIDQFGVFMTSGVRTASAVLLLNAAGWTVAALLALGLRLSRKELIAVGVEHSIRQEGTGVFIAVTVIGNSQMTVPLLLNSIIGLVVSAALLLAMRRRISVDEVAAKNGRAAV
jgi:BASS family bile acid:Na+ symporter